MANTVTNGGFLELTAGWTKSAQLTLAVDETDRGSPGRAVLVGTGVTTANNQQQWIAPASAQRAPVLAGRAVEVSAAAVALVNGASVTPTVQVLWYDNSGAQASPASNLIVSPPQLATAGIGLAGVRDTFHRVQQRVTPPTGAVTAALRVSATPAAAGASVGIGLLKPMIGAIPAGRTDPMTWDPGSHTDTDLAFGIWPDVLRPFQSGPGSEPVAGRIEFQAGAGRPASRRTAVDPARRFSGVVRCDAVQRAALEAFWRDGPADFYFVEPDSDRLCVASWAQDGAPRMAESRGPTVLMEVGLWLETA